ncbi:type II toxin-antitoxin system RelB/DinJ family antitoxin [Pelagibacterium lacus]|uniref:Type II toxin-antitoxin system RelB/DinJ family antitoxin n=1 Tax=Pelagibacterium lacus TaxID=2282655 RepID=A0A369VYZ1_9HYPH|nr:type II toxin-antitoxin system RelB/DinJ family antitoxin [Pelagibacterium lacus]RDE07616.1 type II toxin-antitoxin system RelB/DinJ family antitoxin [Pelagibacterium lacus]
MAANAVVRARIDEEVKDQASAVLEEMGLTISDVLRMTLIRVARDKAIPFEIKIPNAETRAAMEEGRRIMKERRLRFQSAEEMFDALAKEAGES